MGLVRPITLSKAYRILSEIFFDKTDRVTKINPGSALEALFTGMAKLFQLGNKDIAVVESQLFPDTADGIHLDRVAANFGIAPRFGAAQSSTYLRLVGQPGTMYESGVHTFTGPDGITFDLVSDVTIGPIGYTYALVRSQQTGSQANVPAGRINQVNPVPAGSQYVVNEFTASGGRDIESDGDFRRRIKDGSNILARGTLAAIEQAFIRINPSVFRVLHQGVNGSGDLVLAVVSVNGMDFTGAELNRLQVEGQQFFSLTELKPNNAQGYGIELVNVTWQPIDISLRLRMLPSFNADDVRKSMQIRMNSYVNYRKWEQGDPIRWVELLVIAENTPGVDYVLSDFFTPGQDIMTDIDRLPRIRGFVMMDVDGNVISSGPNALNPVFYPTPADFIYQSTALRSLS